MGEPKAGVMMSWNVEGRREGEEIEIENERSCRQVRQRRIDLTGGGVLRFVDIAVRTGRFAPSRTASSYMYM